MEGCCAVCADPFEWLAYGPCGHSEVCSTCTARLRFIFNDKCCCICKQECPTVFVTKALEDNTKSIKDFIPLPASTKDGKVGDYWFHSDIQACFDDEQHYKMIKAMCRLSCSLCEKSSISKDWGSGLQKQDREFKHIDELKGHLYHVHKLKMCNLCLESRKFFVGEQKLYTRAQLDQHLSKGDSEVDGSEIERGGFMGHPICDFCQKRFYGENELYRHMQTEHYTCHICQRSHPDRCDYYQNYNHLEAHFSQEHFLCENLDCLAKKFIVFSEESELKRHHAIEHAGKYDPLSAQCCTSTMEQHKENSKGDKGKQKDSFGALDEGEKKQIEKVMKTMGQIAKKLSLEPAKVLDMMGISSGPGEASSTARHQTGSSSFDPPNLFRTSIGSRGINIKIKADGKVLQDSNGKIFYDSLRDYTYTYFDATLDKQWRQQEKECKKKLIQQLQNEFGSGWSVEKALQKAGKNLNWKRDKIRIKVKKIDAEHRRQARDVRVDQKVWKSLMRTVSITEARRKDQNKPSVQEKASQARFSKSQSARYTHKTGSAGKAGLEAMFFNEFNRLPTDAEMREGIKLGWNALKEYVLTQQVYKDMTHQEKDAQLAAQINAMKEDDFANNVDYDEDNVGLFDDDD